MTIIAAAAVVVNSLGTGANRRSAHSSEVLGTFQVRWQVQSLHHGAHYRVGTGRKESITIVFEIVDGGVKLD